MKITAKQKNRRRLLLAAAFVALLLWSIWGTTALEITNYTVKSARLPGIFSGFKIAQVSDLHNAVFGQDNENLLALMQEAQPDIIALTGDLVDSRHTDVDKALAFVKQAVQIAPTYYVTGNHEARLKEYPLLESNLKALGVQVLRNAFVTIDKGGQLIHLAGMEDPTFYGIRLSKEEEAAIADSSLASIGQRDGTFTLLLSHRPELFENYKHHGMDVALTGHTHGGQFRLPFIGALLVPSQGFFPKYDAGLYEEEGKTLIISRGLGNSIIPLRVFNRPELVVVTLEKP